MSDLTMQDALDNLSAWTAKRPTAALSLAQMLSMGIPADAEAPFHVHSIFETSKALEEVSRDACLSPDDQFCLLETIAILTHVVQRSAGNAP